MTLQERADAREDLLDEDRLRQEVVGAELDRAHLVVGAGTREKDEGDLSLRRLGPPAELEPVEPGQVEVGDDEIRRWVPLDQRRGDETVGRVGDLEACASQADVDDAQGLRVAVDDENVFPGRLGAGISWFHVFSSSAMRMGVSRMRAGRREYSLIFSSYAVIGDVAKCVRGMGEDLRADGALAK